MKERWKPERNGIYYAVDFYEFGVCEYTWEDDYIDVWNQKSGNCFRTAAEAQAAAEKVKDLLLRLHDNGETLQADMQDKQLPKLTAEVFDRPDCPEWAKYAAVSANGFCYFFENEPSYGVGYYKGKWYVDTGKSCLSSPLAVFSATDWQNSLIERPAPLPDWCKVGEWVWFKGSEPKFDCYTCVTEINEKGVYGKCPDGQHFYSKPDGLAQARLRLYNADELRGLVGKVIKTPKDIAMVLGYSGERNKVCVATMNNYFTAEVLLAVGATIDGKPCGVLEHLENGEWVK